MKYAIEPVTDCAGTKYFILYTHGMLHEPTALLDEMDVRMIANYASGSASRVLSNREIANGTKAMREKYDLTQAHAAELLGISRNYLSMIERGDADNISLEIYRRLMQWIEEAAM